VSPFNGFNSWHQTHFWDIPFGFTFSRDIRAFDPKSFPWQPNKPFHSFIHSPHLVFPWMNEWMNCPPPPPPTTFSWPDSFIWANLIRISWDPFNLMDAPLKIGPNWIAPLIWQSSPIYIFFLMTANSGNCFALWEFIRPQ